MHLQPNQNIFHTRLALTLLVPLCAAVSFSQELTLQEAVQTALNNSPEIKAAQERVSAAEANARRASALPSPQLELAPGVGFTNSNALLSQRIDIGGVTKAHARLAEAELTVVRADALAVRTRVVGLVRTAYADHWRAVQLERSARESVSLAEQLLSAVRKRVEIGEAPQVQVTRSEIEQARFEQDVLTSVSLVEATGRAMNRVLGRSPESPLQLSGAISLPAEPRSLNELLLQATRTRSELVLARSQRDVVVRERDIARAERRPTLTGAVAADVWSLDRRPFRSENIGLQLSLSIPLFNGGITRADEQRFSALLKARDHDLAATERTIGSEVDRAYSNLQARLKVARNYETQILPKAQHLLIVLQTGFESGVTTILEVLDAQRVVRQTQQEYLNALFEAIEAENALYSATGAATSLEGSTSR